MRSRRRKIQLAPLPILFVCSAMIWHGASVAESLTADPGYIYVVIGETKTVTLSGGNFSGDHSVLSSDSSVVTGQLNAMSKDVEITGVAKGEAIITVTDSDSNSVEIRVKVFTKYMSA